MAVAAIGLRFLPATLVHSDDAILPSAHFHQASSLPLFVFEHPFKHYQYSFYNHS